MEFLSLFCTFLPELTILDHDILVETENIYNTVAQFSLGILHI